MPRYPPEPLPLHTTDHGLSASSHFFVWNILFFAVFRTVPLILRRSRVSEPHFSSLHTERVNGYTMTMTKKD
jgi:hypothetical protein